jgi:Immunity protein Imm1
MFINSLHADLWVSRADKGRTLDRPSWEDIERAVRQLNGNERTSLILKRDEETHMSIGGGPDRYSVVVLIENRHGPFYLIDPYKSDAEIMLVVGGQSIDTPERMTVPLETILKAARVFSESGELEKSLAWQVGI